MDTQRFGRDPRFSAPFTYSETPEYNTGNNKTAKPNPDDIPEVLKERLQQQLKSGMLHIDKSFHAGELQALVDWLAQSPFVVREIELTIDADNQNLVPSLITALSSNHTVCSLTLLGTHISDPVSEACGILLHVNKRLEHIRICGDRIDAAGAKAICQGLEANTTLKRLSLENPDFGEGGMLDLAKALEANSGITQVYVRDIPISDVAAKSLAEAIAVNKKLERIIVLGGELSATGLDELAKGVKQSESLLDINIIGQPFSREDCDYIDGVLRRNKHNREPRRGERIAPFIFSMQEGRFDQ